jgi:hypothetical protein
MMSSSAITDKASGSTNELKNETVSAGDTMAVARSVSAQLTLTASEGSETTGTAERAPVTLLAPEPVHLIHAIPGLYVRQAKL